MPVTEHGFDESVGVEPRTASRISEHECPLVDTPVAPSGAEPFRFFGLEQLKARCAALGEAGNKLRDESKKECNAEDELNENAYRVIEKNRGVRPLMDEILTQVAALLDSCDVLKANTQMMLDVRNEMMAEKANAVPIPEEEDSIIKFATDIWQLEQDISKLEKTLGLPAPLSAVRKLVRRRVAEVLNSERMFKVHADRASVLDHMPARVGELLPQSREHLLAGYEAQRTALLAKVDPGSEAALALFSERMAEVEKLVLPDTDPYLTGDLMEIHHFLTHLQNPGCRDNPTYILAIAQRVVTSINENPKMREDLQQHSAIIQQIIRDAEAFLQKPKPEPGHVFKGKALREWESEKTKLNRRMTDEFYEFGVFHALRTYTDGPILSAKAEFQLLPRMKITEQFVRSIIEAHTILAEMHRPNGPLYLQNHVAKLRRLEEVIAALKDEKTPTVKMAATGARAEALFGYVGKEAETAYSDGGEPPKEPEPA